MSHGRSATLEATRPPPSTSPPTERFRNEMRGEHAAAPIFHNTCSFRSANARVGADHAAALRFHHTILHRSRIVSGTGMVVAMTHSWMGQRHQRTAIRFVPVWYPALSRCLELSWQWAADTFLPRWSSTCGRKSGSSGCPSARWEDTGDGFQSQKTETETGALGRRTIQSHLSRRIQTQPTLAKWPTGAGEEYRARRPV